MAGGGVGLGVTGHRRLLDDQGCADLVDEVLATVPSPGDLVSSLAEGADRLVASRALAAGWRLVVVLPLAVDDYVTDFGSDDSRRAFGDLLAAAAEVEQVEPAPRPGAYGAAGYRMLHRVDALVAIWDGGPAAGVGGTAEVVDAARAADLPVAWILNRTFPELRYERWPWAS